MHKQIDHLADPVYLSSFVVLMPDSRVYKFLSLSYRLSCYIIFLFILAQLTGQYFTWPIDVKVAPFVPVEQKVPRLSLCFPMSSLIQKVTYSYFSPEKELYLNMSIGHMLKLAPGPDELMKMCSYRNFSTDSFVTLNKSSCFEYFRVKKFRFNGYICYTLNPPEHLYTLYSVSYTLTNRRVLYELTIQPPLNRGHKLCPILHFSPTPIYDRSFDQEMLPSIKRNESFTLTYHLWDITRLPPPYETLCSNESQHTCHLRCMSAFHAPYGLAKMINLASDEDPNLIIPDYRSKYNGMSISDLRTKHSASCMNACRGKELCRELLTSTHILSPAKSM